MNKYPVIDLHCDLLSYLCDQRGRTIEDSASRASVSQLQAGNVKIQTLAIFSSSRALEDSLHQGFRQVECLVKLLSDYPHIFARYQSSLCEKDFVAEKPLPIFLIPAIENAASFSLFAEPIALSISRLEQWIETIGSPLYISLTWDGENRFGGGNGSRVGLKKDGEALVEWMSEKNIALDVSHASDSLAEDLLNFIETDSLPIKVIASHSNFRSVTGMERNLPEEIGKEIIRRKGLIGLNLFAPFIHKTDPSVLIRHVEYALHLNAHSSLCFGADFFCDLDFPSLSEKYQTKTPFFAEYGNASAYPLIFEHLRSFLGLKEELIANIAYGNALKFLQTT